MNSSLSTSPLSNSGDNQTSENPPFPKDIIDSIVARLPIYLHPIVRQVSKDIKNFVDTKSVYTKRLEISRAEPLLYICLRSHIISKRRDWFELTKKAYNEKFILRSVGLFHGIPGREYSLVTAGSTVYAVGGLHNNERTSDVFSINGVSHDIEVLPKMKEPRFNSKNVVLNQTLYVIGGSLREDSQNWMEALKLKPGSEWESVPCAAYKKDVGFGPTVVMNGKIYHLGYRGECYVYDIKEDRFEEEKALGARFYHGSCVIENRLYALDDDDGIVVYDPTQRAWSVLKVLNLPELKVLSTKLVNYGGNLLIVHNLVAKSIWCTEIALKNREGNMWGDIVTSNEAHHVTNAWDTVIDNCQVIEI
ncbi:unnamed protein product [Brassica rapa]|uniref:FKB95-like N-terminal Kelch domain-containing protein n=1 Tax=Brassica campestris TaxID=3711 RepID=A0A8D9GQI6_BRACM|nr:unnamed protein product [Brassica rapa]